MVDFVVGKLCGNLEQFRAEVRLQPSSGSWATAQGGGVQPIAVDSIGVVLSLQALQVEGKVKDIKIRLGHSWSE